MKKVSAPRQDFDIYVARPGTEFIEREKEPLEALYSQGYLPYSGTKGLQNIFYSARSARIVLNAFALNSENRRIARKFDGKFSKEWIENFAPDEDFYTFCIDYFARKHGPAAMPRTRLETILDSGIISHIITYHDGPERIAHVLEVVDGTMGHYWFSFYNLRYAKQSLGLWLMLDALRDARKRGLTHYYLGTVYGENALYKTNFGPLEWWDGSNWNTDIKLLKEFSRKE